MIEVWKCPKCKIEAKIDRDRRSKEIIHNLNPDRGRMLSFPTHNDCELVKPVGKMNFNKLEKKGI